MSNPYEPPREPGEPGLKEASLATPEGGAKRFERFVAYLVGFVAFVLLTIPTPRETNPEGALLIAGPLVRAADGGVSVIGWFIFFLSWLGLGLFAVWPSRYTAMTAILAIIAWISAGAWRL